VAESDGDIVGQIAVHERSSAPVMDLAASILAQPTDRLGVIARLLVDPSRRRIGAGAALLEHAACEAVGRGLWPILDVVVDSAGAIGLYERCGWIRAGEVTVTFRSGTTVQEFVYLAPVALRPDGVSGR
jgi:GNAT superfamily N-acetyltransferase